VHRIVKDELKNLSQQSTDIFNPLSFTPPPHKARNESRSIAVKKNGLIETDFYCTVIPLPCNTLFYLSSLQLTSEMYEITHLLPFSLGYTNYAASSLQLINYWINKHLFL